MKSLVHEHIVQITGTYETLTMPRQFGILMLPAGDEDLNGFMQSIPVRGYPKRDIQKLEKWLICLASALDYVHSQGIRHGNIKLQNVICKGSEIFLTDFGSAAHKLSKTSSTIESHAAAVYNAPEAISQRKIGRSTEVFSLGCIYAEMCTVITGRRISSFYDHRITQKAKNSSETTHAFHVTEEKIKSWFENSSWPVIFDLLSIMLSREASHRPKAFEVVATFVATTTGPICTCVRGPICLPTYWNLSMQFELLPGIVEYQSPGGMFGLPMPKPDEILKTATTNREEAGTEVGNPELVKSQTRHGDLCSHDLLLGSLLALTNDPYNPDLQKRYSEAEAVSLPEGLRSPGKDRGWKDHNLLHGPPLIPPHRPRRDFSASIPLIVDDEGLQEWL